MKDSVLLWDTVWSRPYNGYARQHEAIWRVVREYAKGKVCDLGCGSCLLYKGGQFDLTGVDSSTKAIEEAKKNYPQGKYLVADICDTGLPEKEFDVVILSGVLDYFDVWTKPLAEARRICKSGGIIIGTLLQGSRGHDWSSYQKAVGNWHLYIEKNEAR